MKSPFSRDAFSLRLSLARALRALVPPLVVALPPLWWTVEAARRASLTTLGRDQGIFQYVAWALTRGQTDYRDVRDVNGPLTHLVHYVFLAFGGADEHRFRVLDLVTAALAFAVAGACIPGATRVRVPRRTPRVLERLAWALAAAVVLGAQYMGYLFWDLAQRESFFDGFVVASIGLQLAGQARKDGRLLALAGALSVIPWFGKPTYLAFTAVQLAALLADRSLDRTRWRLGTFAIGGAVGALTQLAFLAIWGDMAAYARIAFVDVPAMYRFIWARGAWEILTLPQYSADAAIAVTGAVVMLALMSFKLMSPRLLAVALMPIAGLASVLAQGKGFPYHFHPVTAGIALQWVVLVAWAWETARGVRLRGRARAVALVLPLAASAALAIRVATKVVESPHLQSTRLLAVGATPAARQTKAYFDSFPEPDFFPWDLRQAADYLKAHTQPTDRVQTYGMDPYLLFLAERLSATPYIYAYDLNVDAALAGGTGAAPDEAQARVIRGMRDAHEEDMLDRLKKDPPAAFVFFDRAPLLTYANAEGDFEVHCPDTASWMRGKYVEAATFGSVHVFLRGGSKPGPT